MLSTDSAQGTGPRRYILVVPKTAGTMMLRINENDRIRLDAYGERMEVRLEGLSAFVEALDRWRLDASPWRRSPASSFTPERSPS